jgi:saccharopine dehydrogenase (NAD+, L-glutamate forming)
MAIVNTRVVHATNAHLHYPYGSDFTYNEGINVGGKFTAELLAAVSGMFYWAYKTRPLRKLLETILLPKPGEGPSKAAREKGHFEFHLFARTRSDQRLQLIVSGDRDPGYGASSRMIGEVAVCMARDLGKTNLSGGFWTPGAAIADRIVPRLIASAGLKFRLSAEDDDNYPVNLVLSNDKGRPSWAHEH